MIAYLLAAFLVVPARASSSSGTPASRQAQEEHLRGTLLERRGAYAEALASYEKALALDPSAAFIAGEAAELALQLDDYERAEKWARRRLELAPKDARSRVILAHVLWARGDAAGAEAEFEKAFQADPSSADTLFSLTELISARDSKRARKLMEDFLARNPDQAARALFELGRLDAREERYPDAEDKLKRSIELDDAESGPARLTLAQVYEAVHDTDSAIAQYQRLLTDAPDDLEMRAHIGELQAQAGRWDDARDTFAQIKARRPGDPAACAWLAADAERAGDFARAASALKDSAALKDDPTLNLRLGYYQLQAGSMKDALATLEAARRRWPKDDRVAYYLALGRDDTGDHAGAAALLRDVLALKPDDRDARWQLATILERMDKMPEAETEFRRLIQDKPDDAPALNYLGYALADRGLKLDEAEAMIRRALAVEPSNPAYRDSLGWVLFKLGRSTDAARELAASARALPEDDSVWDHLGDARKASGHDEGAWRAWRLSQSFGGAKAGAKADALQKSFSAERVGELWRAHLEAAQGGVRRYAGVCQIRGRAWGRQLSQSALMTFRAPGALDLEILGPLFTPVARARWGSDGFAMDRFPVAGLTDEQVRSSAEGLMAVMTAILGGEPFRPGPAKWEAGWGRRELDRPAWRIEVGDDALARSIAPKGGAFVALSDFAKSGTRRVARKFRVKGRFWEFELDCADPKFELADEPPLPEIP